MSSAARRIPYHPEEAAGRQRQDLERQVREQAAARGLAASEIGNGGTLKVDGSLVVTGSITVPGTLASAGAITAGTDISAGGTITAPIVNSTVLRSSAAPTTIISTGRVAVWAQNSDGLMGTQPSSERFKQIAGHVLDDPDFDPFAVLELNIEYFEYLVELRKRNDPEFEGYVGPPYKVAMNFGPIAERAHELGLWMIVIYEHDLVPITLPDGTEALMEQLRYDESGEPIPFGLHESLFGYLLQMAVKRMRAEALADRANLQALAEHIGYELPN